MRGLTLCWALAGGLLLPGAGGCDDGAENRLHEQVSRTPEAESGDRGGSADEGTEGREGEASQAAAGGGGSGQGAAGGGSPASQRDPGDPLLHPEEATEQAPGEYTVELGTTEGDILIDVHRAWAPKGADRFYNLVKLGFYDDTAFFRAMEGFVAQVGLKGEPAVDRAWRGAKIEDDPVKESNTRGTVTFATSGEDSRTTQIFLNLGDNTNLDEMGFAPFGEIRDESMKVVDALHTGYGESPSQGRIKREGNEYLRSQFPKLDWIEEATIVEPDGEGD